MLPRSLLAWLRRSYGVDEAEARALALSFLYNFFLFSGYYILQPLRDGLIGADRKLPWLFGASLGLMVVANALFAWVVSRWPRRVFLPMVYRSAIACLVVVYLVLPLAEGVARVWLARAYFLWLGVFSLFAVSVFWAFMSDLWTRDQGKKLFGVIGAGGTLGQLAGSWFTGASASTLAPQTLVLVSCVLLELAVWCVQALGQQADEAAPHEGEAQAPAKAAAGEGPDPAAGSPLWEGIALLRRSPYLLAICAYLFLYTFTSSFLYFAKQEIAEAAFGEDAGARTAFFAQVNLAISVVTVTVQTLVTGALLTRLGLTFGLVLVPVVTTLGLATLAASPGLWLFAAIEVTRKGANYAVARPSRELLYTVVTRDERYKSKSFIDTFVYRGGDAVAALAFGLLQGAGLALGGLLLAGVPAALLWMATGVGLGRAQEARAAAQEAGAAAQAPPTA